MQPLILAITLAAVVAGCHASTPALRQDSQASGSGFLFVWAGDADTQQSDFLASVDVDPRSATYASVVATVPVGAAGTRPHHTEYEMPAAGILWANGFDAGQTFLFDLRQPARPTLLRTFSAAGAFGHPHSYARLPNGNILATFQHRTGGNGQETGGLIEFNSTGEVLRTAEAAAPTIDPGVRPYSLAVLPDIDRVVTTATDMHLHHRSRAIQVWRLSDLTLLQTLLLPTGSRGDENWLTAEPRVLADGRSVLVNTFTCGLYRVNGLAGDTATVEWVHSTPWQERQPRRFCAVPVVHGRFWLQASGPERAVISLDISDPSRPREVSRLTLGPNEVPHWLALEPNGERVVITGYEALESRILLARLDRTSGALRLDASFQTPGAKQPGVDFGRDEWPHGRSGAAIPHGAVFSRSPRSTCRARRSEPRTGPASAGSAPADRAHAAAASRPRAPASATTFEHSRARSRSKAPGPLQRIMQKHARCAQRRRRYQSTARRSAAVAA
jgi:hypothetical protein